MPAHSQDHLVQYLRTNNPFDSFLEARFIKNDEGFVSTNVLWTQWDHWLRVNRIDTVKVSRNRICIMIEQQSSWPVRRYRRFEGPRGLKGMSLRRSPDDEQ